jgi:hypothetical protein
MEIDIAKVIKNTPELVTPLLAYWTPRIVKSDKRYESVFWQ